MIDFPENWEFGRTVSRAMDSGLDWIIINFDPFFDAITIFILRGILLPLEKFLLWLPWWLVVAVVVLIAFRINGRKIAFGTALGMMLLGGIGLWDLAMSTLAIVLASTLLAIGMGMPLGILGAKNDRFDGMMRPILDGMQTMPSFVYLIPALMLLGLGKVPAVMATVIYSIPPIIRLTNLGIRQVDPEVIEAARAFGSTGKQILLKVQIPMAIPTIMAGVNQTIMMALAMVVIASMIGAKTIGTEVLNGIARLEVGRGFIGGVGIVIMAIIIDRISQGLAKPRRIRSE